METPNQLYKRTPEKVTHDVTHLSGCYYNHVIEVCDDFQFHSCDIKTDRVEIRFLKDFHFDHRRVWQLATVWFDLKPVMVIQNAGREGDDYHARFITDPKTFSEMCSHLRQLIAVDAMAIPNIYDADAEVPGLTDFYNNDLDGIFTHNLYYY